jgi:hypothetical protein
MTSEHDFEGRSSEIRMRGIASLENDFDASVQGLRSRLFDHGRREVDARDFVAGLRHQQAEASSATPNIKDTAGRRQQARQEPTPALANYCVTQTVIGRLVEGARRRIPDFAIFDDALLK